MNIFRIKWTAQPELDFRIRTIGNKNNYRESFYILVLYCDLLISYRVEKEDKRKYNSCCKLHTAFEFLVKIPSSISPLPLSKPFYIESQLALFSESRNIPLIYRIG